jgi:hypothetical protein
VRSLAISVLFLLGCKTTLDWVPVTPAVAQRAAAELSSNTEAKVRDTRGVVHDVSNDASVRGDEIIGEVVLRDSLLQIKPTGSYSVGIPKSVPDGGRIAGWTLGTTLVSGLIAANVACFGTNVCADGSKVAVGVIDGVVIVAVVVSFVALVAAWSHFRGD